MTEMNEHSSFDGKGLRSMLIEKFHRKFSHAKGVDGTENGNMAQEEDYENARQEMKQGFESPSGTSMDPDVEMDMEMETNGFDITDSSSVDMIHDKPFSHYENAPTSKPKPFPKQLSLNTDASTWYVLEQQVSTPVMTPVNQSGPHQVYTKRHDSVSSLASSVSELGYANGRTSTANNLSSIPAPFTTQFVSLLLEVYLQVCSDPLVTPFDSSNPPSGILHRVSKLAVDAADADQVEIGLERNSWLLTLVRQRLLKEVRKESYMSRNSSVISLPPAPQFGHETSSTNMQQHSPQDYFSCNAMGAANSPPSSFPTNNYYAGLNSPFESRPSSQHQQLQQPLQLSQSSAQAAPQHPKSLARSRNNSFITAASRSRSNSFKVHPQLTNTLGSVQTPPLPNLTRSRSSSNAHFFLTPTNSIPSQSSYFSQSTASVNTLLNSNSSTINTAAAGQQLDERTARLPTHLENESHL